jgi:hypothetical protein
LAASKKVNMNNEIFINSIFNKFEKLFFKKKLKSKVTLVDDDNEQIIDNVIYIQIDDEHVGILVNGVCPNFTKSFIEDIDMFNLYWTYNSIRTISTNISTFRIDSINVFFDTTYSELIGCYLCDNLDKQSFSIIFMTDELKVFENIPLAEYINELDNNLQHIKSKKNYSINNEDKSWKIN